MAQLSVNANLPGLQRGQLVGSGHRIVERFNQRKETRTVTVTYDAAGQYSITITGVPYDGGPQQSVSLGPIAAITDATATATAIKNAIKANAIANAIVDATSSAGVITLVARRAGALTVTSSATGGSAAFVTATTVSEQQLEAGVMVSKDTAGDKFIRQPETSVVGFDGITLWPKVEDGSQALSGLNVWPARFDVSICRRGVIGVFVEQAVTPATAPHVRHNPSGANQTRGAFRTDTDSGNATAFTLGAFIGSASAGGVAPFEINLP